MRHSFTRPGRLLVVAGVLAVGSANADEPATAVRPPAQGNTSADPSNPPEAVALPTCLKQLDLSSEQQGEIQAVVRNHEADFAAVWKQFGARYVEAIRVEAMLLSAIEDNLTEAQRKHVREQRRRLARDEKQRGETTDRTGQEPGTKPVSAVAEELAIVGVSLTPEQEAAADKVQEKYISLLRSLNRDLEGLHARLVSLEADQFVEIEKVLTEAQLKKLCEIRQSAPPVAASDSGGTRR